MSKSKSKPRVIPVMATPQEINGRYQDLYGLRFSSLDGLPPHARAKAILETFHLLRKERPWASLSVLVEGPGTWYFKELRQHLENCGLPIRVAQLGYITPSTKYYVPPDLLPTKPAPPEFVSSVFDETKVPRKELTKIRFLRQLARMVYATTGQLASMVGFGETQTTKYLRALESDGFVTSLKDGIEGEVTYNVWKITKNGVRHANWSWNIPLGVRFKDVREEQRYSGVDHHDGSRRFPSRVKKAYGAAFEMWQAWTELPLSTTRSFPDTLVWGTYLGMETLIWLEFETAHKSEGQATADMMMRFNKAQKIALQQGVHLIFVIITKLWLMKRIQELGCFWIRAHTALVIEYSENPECLAEPLFGGFNSVISNCGFPRILDLSKILQEYPDYFLPKLRTEVLDAVCSEVWSIKDLEIK